jgi:putative redox protein
MNEVNLLLPGDDFTCTINDGLHTYICDEPIAQGGKGLGPDPYSYLLASLGSCTAITLKMYADRKGWKLDGVAIKLSLERNPENRSTVFTREITISSKLDQEQEIRLHQIAKACPVSKILEGNITIDTVLTSGGNIIPVNKD